MAWDIILCPASCQVNVETNQFSWNSTPSLSCLCLVSRKHTWAGRWNAFILFDSGACYLVFIPSVSRHHFTVLSNIVFWVTSLGGYVGKWDCFENLGVPKYPSYFQISLLIQWNETREWAKLSKRMYGR